MTRIYHYIPLAAGTDADNYFADQHYLAAGWSLVSSRTLAAKRLVEAAGGQMSEAIAKYPWLQDFERCNENDAGARPWGGGFFRAVPVFGIPQTILNTAYTRVTHGGTQLIHLFDQTRLVACTRRLAREGVYLSIYTGYVNEEVMPTDAEIDSFAALLHIAGIESLIVDGSSDNLNRTAVERLERRLVASGKHPNFLWGEACSPVGGHFDRPERTCFMTDRAFRQIGGMDGLRLRECNAVVAFEGTTDEEWASFLEAARGGVDGVAMNMLTTHKPSAVAELVQAVTVGNGGRA